jgi:L-aminopeptidase/D-esterase-like protein
MSMQEVHAILLTGGSAFGLAAADGVVRYLEEHGVGYETPWARVPIVPAAVIYDLNIGSPAIRPGPEAGYSACVAASYDAGEEGNIGAGAGATVGKWGGLQTSMKGGFGLASAQNGQTLVCALAVVNAVGDVLDDHGRVLAGARTAGGSWLADTDSSRTLTRGTAASPSNTTLIVLLTNAPLTKVDVNRLAERGHDGMARAIRPVHTSFDGDLVFALSSGGPDPRPFDLVAEMGADATAGAIRNAVRAAATAGGFPGMAGA